MPTLLIDPNLPNTDSHAAKRLVWRGLNAASTPLAIAEAASTFDGLVCLITHDMEETYRLKREIPFFLDSPDISVLHFPDQETLPYDLFSPLPELTSIRLAALSRLPTQHKGILIVPIATLMQYLPPQTFLQQHSFVLDVHDILDLDETRRQLDKAGYHCVSQVMRHGEFAIRGSIIDVFPMGSKVPYRIDLFDNEVEAIYVFDPETQRSKEKVTAVRLLPTHEFPLTPESIDAFRQRYSERFSGNLNKDLLYQNIASGNPVGGIEYFLPLFFEQTYSLFDYLPDNTLCISLGDVHANARAFIQDVEARYEQRRHDIERRVLPASELYLSPQQCCDQIQARAWVNLSEQGKPYVQFKTDVPPDIKPNLKAKNVYSKLHHFIQDFPGKLLFAAESAGRQEIIREMLVAEGLQPTLVHGWQDCLRSAATLTLTIAPLEHSLLLADANICVITEAQLLEERVQQSRHKSSASTDANAIIRNLTELEVGAPVVHQEYGVGRFLGLQTIHDNAHTAEYLTLEYAKGDRLYIPVSSLHLVSRYTGASPEHAPLHRLGTEQWRKARKKAAEKMQDVAAQLLDVYARRAARKGHAFQSNPEDYQAFAAAFPFEETPDQAAAILATIQDMTAEQPMDRVVCGDVGFGKTEVAMRAAFVAANGGKQVAILVPTTLLSQQHHQNFIDRFADWPFQIESLSRFRTKKQQDTVLKALSEGKVDIVIGTHKLIQKSVKFADLGLVIIDEEHRFGVKQKEVLKALRSEVDILSLTATPIPRTLNMAMSGLRDLSIIATPPAHRHPIQTFLMQWDVNTVQEACSRELKRGGQVYFLHNDIKTIEKTAQELAELIPHAKVRFGHGQMREHELEQIMLDFYHQRFNILVATTIIESGIDVPSANTIIINRADRLGLAQLHQIRGRVGRSHHRAYAYLIIPDEKVITSDAKKRLEALISLEDLGAGFTLSTHDLEIRGAGELLGDEQTGQIHEIGFTLYTELLERAITALKAGKQPELDKPLDQGPEITLQIPALLPEDYIPDVHTRLVLYKRIASATSKTALKDLQVEMIDRFGLIPEAGKNLFKVTSLKLRADRMRIQKIDASAMSGRILFHENPNVDTHKIIQLIQTRPKEFQLDGQHKLKFFASMDKAEARIQKIESILSTLTG